MYKILIVGVGQLGSRYLQGLATVPVPLDIVAVDPGRESRSVALARWQEVCPVGSIHKIQWVDNCDSIYTDADLAIIATAADRRADVVQELNSVCRVRYWVLEKVVSQSINEMERIKSAVDSSDGSWVNMPRRIMGWHKDIAGFLDGCGALNVSIKGGMWGMACNSLHFLDLVSWWTGETLTSIDTSQLENTWFESKRSGFYEVCGSMVASYSAGSSILLSSDPVAQEMNIKVESAGKKMSLLINENQGSARSSHGHSIQGKIDMQSILTRPLVESILLDAKCALPTLADSSQLHEIFLNAMLGHWNSSRNCSDLRVPIT